MTIIQTYSKEEMFYGQQSFRFAVSDNYDDLFKSDELITNKIYTNIILTKSVKKDLELEDGSFAISEMQFEINSASCMNDDDRKALHFCLQATSNTQPRYVAFFFSATPSLEDLMFVGRIDNKVSGDDLLWDADFYATAINPERNYSFTALSFDIEMLSECKIEGNVYNQNNEIQKNLYQRLFSIDNHDYLLNGHPYRYMFDGFKDYYLTSPITTNYTAPLVNLHTYLSMVLTESAHLLSDIYNLTLDLSLDETEVGLEGLPATYDHTKLQLWDNFDLPDTYLMRLDNWYPSATKKVKLIIGTTATTTESPIFIHRKLIHDRLGDTGDDLDTTGETVIFKKQREKDRNLSFASYESVADILFSIAKSLGCFVVVEYTAYNSIQIRFVSRENIVSNEVVYVVGSDKSSFDTGITTDNEKSNYYSLSTTHTVEAKDIAKINKSEESEEYAKLNKALEELKEAYKYENIRLALSISPILSQATGYSSGISYWGYFPLNMYCRNIADGIVETANKTDYKNIAVVTGSTLIKEELHTGIYIKTNPFDLTGTQPDWIHRPVAAIVKKKNGTDTIYTKLADYINDIYLGSQEAYQTEYELTVPFWNGFNNSQTFSGSSWKKLKLGSKMELSEPNLRWDSDTSTWITETVTRTYVVVGIEYSLDKPETKVKLLNISAFAFGYVDSIPDYTPQSLTPPDPTGEGTLSENYVTGYEIDSGTIEQGDPVRLLSNGKIAIAENNSSKIGTIGIAIGSGTAGDTIAIQVSGVVTFSGWSLTPGLVFLRVSDISSTPLATPDVTEDVYSIIGTALSPTSLLLNIREYIWQA